MSPFGTSRHFVATQQFGRFSERSGHAGVHRGFSDWQTRLPVRKMVRHNQDIIRGNHGVMDLASLRRSCDLCKTNLMVA
jgi:hypothetical protein